MLDFPVRQTLLDNGLKVLTVEHHVAPITSVWAWYRVGSRNERPGITGISHWTEHMCFKGGAEFDKGDIFHEVSRVGGYNNGMTGNDYTVYFETVPGAHADLGLRVEADRMTGARFDPEEVASERSVIISEREGAENHPQFLLGEEMSLTAFRAHPYRWSVIGWKSDLREITHADLWSHYQQFYAPDNAVLLVVGDFETEEMLRDIERLYGGIAGRADVPPIRSVEPPQEGERRFTLRRPGSAAYLQIAHHIPQAGHEDEPALRVLSSVLGGTGSLAWLSPSAGGWRTSRIYRALVESGLAASASAHMTPRGIDPGLGGFNATVRVGVDPERVEEAMLQVIADAVAAPPTDEEMQRAKTQLAAAMAYAGESATGIASLLGGAEMVGGYKRVAQMPEQIAAVTAQDVLRVAQTYLTNNNRTTGWFIPTEPGGGGECAPGAFTRFFYTGLEIFRNATRRTLDNGLRVVACESSVTPSVSLAGSIRGGGCLDTDAQAGRARFATGTMDRGTTTRSFRQIAEALDGVGATFGLGAGPEFLSFSSNCLNESLGLVAEIGSDVLQSPAFPEDECERVRSEILTSLRESADNTRDVAVKAARQLLYPEGHPFHVWDRGEIAALESLTRAGLAAYHRLAVRPDETILTLVGDVDPAQAVALIEERFGAWQVAGAATVPDLSAEPPAETRTCNLVMPNKTQCDIVIATTLVPRHHEDYLALDFATRLLGQLGFMGRFGKTVRDELGLAYYCFCAGGESRGNAMWIAQAGVNPQNVQLAVDTMLQQMRIMQQELVSEAEYDELIANRLGSLAMLTETKQQVAWSLLALEKWDLGADYYERLPDLVRAVTREHILEAARQYFRPEAHVRVVAGPKWHE
jgi:zinc protease